MLLFVTSAGTDMPPNGEVMRKSTYVLGCDVARLGEDDTVILVLEQPFGDDYVYCVYIDILKHKLITESVGRIKWLHERFNFRKAYIDCTGLGAGAADALSEVLGGIVEPMTFTIQLKQDIYSNLKVLLEQGKIKIPNHKQLLHQLRDLKYEFKSSGNMSIHHSERGHDDLPDALALAAYYWKPKPKSRYFAI